MSEDDDEKQLRTTPSTRLSDDQVRLRREVKRIAHRVYSGSRISLETLGEPLGYTKMYVWHILREESAKIWPITLDMVVAWSRYPATQEFARRLLVELIAHVDAQQLRLTDLQRLSDSPFPAHNQIVVDVVRTLAERCGLIPANQTTTAEVPIPTAVNGNK